MRIFTYIKIEEGATHAASSRISCTFEEIGTPAAQEHILHPSVRWLPIHIGIRAKWCERSHSTKGGFDGSPIFEFRVRYGGWMVYRGLAHSAQIHRWANATVFTMLWIDLNRFVGQVLVIWISIVVQVGIIGQSEVKFIVWLQLRLLIYSVVPGFDHLLP